MHKHFPSGSKQETMQPIIQKDLVLKSSYKYFYSRNQFLVKLIKKWYFFKVDECKNEVCYYLFVFMKE